MQLHELFVQPPSEHAISTIEKRATALNNKAVPFRSKNKDEIHYVIQLSILALKFLFHFYCWRDAVKNDHIPPSSTPSLLG